VQQFPSAHFDDLEERVNQLMATRHAHTQLSHTHAVHQSCSYCYRPSHRINDCTFLNHYVTETNKSTHENVQTTTILVSEEKVVNKVEEKEEQSEPLPIPNLSKDKEVSAKAHSFIDVNPVKNNETQ
jgi:Zn-finger protein